MKGDLKTICRDCEYLEFDKNLKPMCICKEGLPLKCFKRRKGVFIEEEDFKNQ